MRSNWLLAALLVLYVIYAGAFIWYTSIPANGERYFLLFDDAMISMRYARNLSSGFGLVWNPGEVPPVEGYTNPLWTLYLSLLHFLPIAQSKICLAVQATGIVVQVTTIFLVKRLSERLYGQATALSFLPAVLTAFYLPLNSWSLQGMEVGILGLLLAATALLVHRTIADGKSAMPVFVLFFVAVLVRMDSVVPLGVTVAFLFFADKNRRWQHVLQGGAALAASLAILESFRYFYYHALLPNTYYLKLQGYPADRRIAQGLFNLSKFISTSNPALFALGIFGLFKMKEKTLLYLAAIFATQCAYSVYVGGDAWEDWGSRYIVQSMPLFFIIFAAGVGAIAQVKLPRMPVIAQITAAAVAVVSLFSFNNVPGLPYLFFLRPGISHEALITRLNATLALNKVLNQQASVAFTWAGNMSYFIGNRPVVDMLGKCDAVVAKEPMHDLTKVVPAEASWRWFYPGHMKWDYKHSIGDLAPDVVAELWGSPEEAQPYLSGKYKRMSVGGYPMYLKIGSPNIDWKSPVLRDL